MLHGGVVSVEGERADPLSLCTHHMTSLEPIGESDYGIFCRMLDGQMGRVFWYTPIKTKEKMLLLLCDISHPKSEQMVCFSMI